MKVWHCIAIGMVGCFFIFGWYAMIRMPGTSFQGSLPPLTSEEQALEVELRSHVVALAQQIGERNLWHFDGLQQSAAYIRENFQQSGYEVNQQPYEVMGKTCENLEVEVLGSSRSDEILLIGAHYDSVKGSPGANDNGTGVAAVLALARIFKHVAPSRTVRFVAFANEEPPFFRSHDMGSRVYARGSRQKGEQIILMVSLETIGYYTEEAGTQGYPFPLQLIYPSTGNFIAFVSNTTNGHWVRQAIGSFRHHTQFPSEGAALFGWLPGVGWSDHWAFWKEDFPAIMVTDTALFRDPYYHTGKDSPDHIRYDDLARVVSGLQQVILDLANPS